MADLYFNITSTGHFDGPDEPSFDFQGTQSSIRQLITFIRLPAPRRALQEYLHTLCIFWLSHAPTSRYHYRLRKCTEQWLLIAVEILSFSTKNNVKWPYLTDAQYRKIVNFRDIVNSNPARYRIVLDREMAMRYIGATAMNTSCQSEGLGVENIDSKYIEIAYDVMTIAWGRLGEELKQILGLSDIMISFGRILTCTP